MSRQATKLRMLLLLAVALLPTACFSATPAPTSAAVCSIPNMGPIHLLASEIPALSDGTAQQIADHNAAYEKLCP